MGAILDSKKLHYGKLNGKQVLGKINGKSIWKQDEPSPIRVTQVAPLSVARRSPRGIELTDGNVMGAIFAGGQLSGNNGFENATYSSAVDYYDNTFTRFTLADLSVARNVSGGVNNGTFTFIGGSGLYTTTRTDFNQSTPPTIPAGAGVIDIYNESFTRLTPRNYGVIRVWDAITHTGQWIAVAGGFTLDYQASNVVEIYNSGATLTYGAPLPDPVWAPRSGRWRNRGTIYGGILGSIRDWDYVVGLDCSRALTVYDGSVTQTRLEDGNKGIRNGSFIHLQRPHAIDHYDKGIYGVLFVEYEHSNDYMDWSFWINEETEVRTYVRYESGYEDFCTRGTVEQGRGKMTYLQDGGNFFVVTANWDDAESGGTIDLKYQKMSYPGISRTLTGSAAQSPYLMIAGGDNWGLINTVELISTNYRTGFEE